MKQCYLNYSRHILYTKFNIGENKYADVTLHVVYTELHCRHFLFIFFSEVRFL